MRCRRPSGGSALTRTIVALSASALVLVGCAGQAPTAGATDGEPSAASAEAAGDLLVAGASDLRPAFELLGDRFTEDTGIEVVFDFGSSGQLAQRIIEGQPVDVFASADAGYVDQVLAAGVGDRDTRVTYASGRVVVWSDDAGWGGWETLEDVVADPDVVNVAIANPDHAPYGVAAEEALLATGTHDAVEDRLVFGENISDTQRLVETGNADVGIIALSLAIAADERDVGVWFLLDEDLHEPLQQDLVVTATDPDRAADAAAFAAFVDGEDGRAVMRRFGFLLPGEELAP